MKIINVGELSSRTNYIGLIYGQPGIGKTTLALSASNPLLIDIDRGLYRVDLRHHKPSVQIDTYVDLLDVLKDPEIKKFDTLIFDTLGKLIDKIGLHVADNNPKLRQSDGSISIKGWGAVKVAFNNLITRIQELNKSVIFVAHESEEKDGEITKKRPDVSGSARKDIIKELDFLGYMEALGNKRTISFNPNEKYYAKNACGLYDILEIPDLSKQAGNTFIIDKIEEGLRKKREDDKKTLQLYNELLNKIDSEIANLKTLDDFNNYLEKTKNENHIWDSKFYTWNKLQNLASNFNFKYNSQIGAFSNV